MVKPRHSPSSAGCPLPKATKNPSPSPYTQSSTCQNLYRCLIRKHAFGSLLHHTLFREQSSSLEANVPKLKSSWDKMRTFDGKGNDSHYLNNSLTFVILWAMYFPQKASTTILCRKCDKKWYHRYAFVVDMSLSSN